jgi:hypothetical protein
MPFDKVTHIALAFERAPTYRVLASNAIVDFIPIGFHVTTAQVISLRRSD